MPYPDRELILPDKDRELLHRLLDAECSMQMSHDLVDEFINLGRLRFLRRRECIIRAGDIDDDLYIIVSGIMRSWYRNGEQEVTQAFGPPGAIVQSFSLLLRRVAVKYQFRGLLSGKAAAHPSRRLRCLSGT